MQATSILGEVELVYDVLTGHATRTPSLANLGSNLTTVASRAQADVTISLLEELFKRRKGRVRPLLRLILSHLRAAVYRHAGTTGSDQS